MIFNEEKLITKKLFVFKLIFLIYHIILAKIFYIFKLEHFFNLCVYKICLIGGPVFIKIAQNLSNKNFNILNLNKTLKRFQNNNFDYIKELPDSDYLKTRLNLDSISKNPKYSGSIAMVYECSYKGKRSALKLLHHDIKKKTILSINVFNFLINRANGSLLKDIEGLIEFDNIFHEIYQQINLKKEVYNINKFKENFKDFKNLVIIPDVYSYDKNYIIESYEEGFSFSEFILKYPNKTENVINLLYSVFYKMFFDNFIHVDFHESNFKFKFENDQIKLVLLDFGIVSTIEDKKIYLSFLNIYKKNIFLANPKLVVDLFIKLNKSPKADIEKFKNYADDYLEKNKLCEKTLVIKKQTTSKITHNFDSLKPNVIIKDLIKRSIECNIKINDTVFNIMNSMLLLDDFVIKSGCIINYTNRMKFAEENKFLENMKNNLKKLQFS